jgi:voltage-gated potassium channel
MENFSLTSFQKLPLVNLDDENALKVFSTKSISAAVIDILDGDLWSSKVSLVGNFVLLTSIVISTLTYVLSNGQSYESSVFLSITDNVIGCIFIFEILGRLIFAKYLGYGNRVFPPLFYVFSFIGLIDVLAVFPFVAGMMGWHITGVFASVRILRMWRITRYITSFRGVAAAFHSRRDEILVTLMAVLLLSLTLSAVMYHAEISAGSDVFASIVEVFVWSMGKYTGDYGAIAGAVPASAMGKLIATINGLLGIALFAIPAGILASAFIDQLSEERRKKEIAERFEKLHHFFLKSSGGGKHIKYKTRWRNASFETLQAKFVFSDQDLFEAIRESPSLRFRAMKSSPELKYNDTRIVEFFEKNCSYGYRSYNKESRIHLINPIGNSERGISHFSATLGRCLNTNYYAREVPLEHKGDLVGGNKSIYYKAYLHDERGKYEKPFQDFMTDVFSANSEDLVVILSSAASGRSSFVLESRNSSEEFELKNQASVLGQNNRLEECMKIVKNSLTNVHYRSPREADVKMDFTMEENTIGIQEDTSLLNCISKKTGADVVAIYVNIGLLTADDDAYYTTLTALGQIIEKLQLLYSKLCI